MREGAMRGWVLGIAVAVGLAVPSTAGAQPAPAAAASSVWVTVSVATLWTSPSAPRSVDAPALTNPAHIRRWLHDMSVADRRGLNGRVETQALYGERLRVVGRRGSWLHVEAPGQPTHRTSHGYPGWVPLAQTTTTAPQSAAHLATVTTLTAWLRDSGGTKVLEVSIGTALPVVAANGDTVSVASPTHRMLRVAATAVVVHSRGTPARALTRSGVIATAREFLGVGYLWGGRSGFGVDCSGFTELVYRVHGRAIPRDADDQARAGSAVGPSVAHKADLLLFDEGGTIGHVGFALGDGSMLHAPHTGAPVRVNSMGAPTLARQIIG